jgi:hypothetical protein
MADSLPPALLQTPIVFERVEAARTHWEYHIETRYPESENPLSEEQLNALGGEGWLLVGTVRPAGNGGPILYYFVRQAE